MIPITHYIMKDYYTILGVAKTATQPEIKRAFRKLAHEHHPDKNNGNDAKFKEANEAYQVLGDPKKRAQYDQFGANFGEAGNAEASGFSGFDFSGFRQGASQGFNVNFEDLDLGDIFSSDMFGFSGRHGRRARERAGADIQVDLEIPFLKVFTGSQEKISLRKEVVCDRCQGAGAEPGSKITDCVNCKGTGRVETVRRTFLGNFSQVSVCPECQGQGKKIDKLCQKCQGAGKVTDNETIAVDIPAGISDGQTIKVENRGNAGRAGGQSGDLYVNIHVKPSYYFTRHGDDVESDLRVSFTQAALGGEAGVTTWNGEVKLKIPRGTQTGKVFILSGKGIPHLQGSGRGDQLVRVNVIVPRHLSRREKELLKMLEQECGEAARVD